MAVVLEEAITPSTQAYTGSGSYPMYYADFTTINANDLLIACIWSNGNTGNRTHGAPSGWTEFLDTTPASNPDYCTCAAYYKVATGSESGTYSISHSGYVVPSMIAIARFSGVDTSTPIESATTTAWATTANTTVPAMSVSNDGSMCVACPWSHANNWFWYDLSTYYANRYTYGTSVGDDHTIGLFTYADDAGTSPSDDLVNIGATPKTNLSFVVRAPATSGYANDVIGVASANIGKVCGVSTANIDKVIGS